MSGRVSAMSTASNLDEQRPRRSASTGGMPVLAAILAVTSWTLAVLSLVAFFASDAPLDSNQLFFFVDVSAAAVYGTVSGIVLARRVHVVPLILATTAVGCGLAAFGYAYEQLSLVRPELPGVGVLFHMQNTAWVPGTLGLFLVVPWLVRLGPMDRRAWAGLVTGIAVTAYFFVVSVLGWREDSRLDTVLVFTVIVVVGLAATAGVLRRWRHGPADERVGMGWLAWGTGLMTLSFLPLIFVPWIIPFDTPVIWMATPLVHLAVQAFYPAAIMVVILRQRMWGLDLVVSRAVVAGTLTVLLVVLYAVLATALARLLPEVGAGFLAAAGVAVAVQPSRLWVQRHVHRLVYGDGVDPNRAVSALGSQFGSAETVEELMEGLAAGVGSALRLESVTIYSVDDAHSVVAAWGTPSGVAHRVSLVHRGIAVGELDVTAPPGELLGSRTAKSLAELSAVVAAGIALMQASADLHEARERLSSVRLEERLVIRRELHDGLGPSLAGIRLGLQGVRNLVTTSPDSAIALLDSLQHQLDFQVDGVRSLSRSLFPPVLDEPGLDAALRELSAAQGRSGFDLKVHCEVPDALDPAVAAACYGIVAEAVTNVRRHSRASEAIVEVRAVRSLLSVTVTDRGSGIGPSAVPGVGSRSMRERAAERGGTLEIRPAEGGGTVVHGEFPL